MYCDWLPKLIKCKNLYQIKILKKQFLKAHTSTDGKEDNARSQKFMRKKVLYLWNILIKMKKYKK